jgi:uncharacterized protein
VASPDPEGTVRTVLGCISEGRYGDLAGFLTDDFVFELPFGPEGFKGPFDKASFDAMQQATFRAFDDFRLTVTEVHTCADSGAVVVEYASDATVAANGRPYRNRYIGVFRVRDDQLTFWREFNDPDVVTKAFAP